MLRGHRLQLGRMPRPTGQPAVTVSGSDGRDQLIVERDRLLYQTTAGAPTDSVGCGTVAHDQHADRFVRCRQLGGQRQPTCRHRSVSRSGSMVNGST